MKIREDIVGESNALQKALMTADRVAPLKNVNILIEGGKGAGKEMLAKRIIHQSKRNNPKHAFIDCSSLDGRQLLNTLSNHAKTLIGGIIFLKSIEKMNFLAQDGLYELLAKKKSLSKNSVRILSSCCENFQDHVDKGLFRKRLYNILASMTIRVPFLKERDEDIELLAKYFLNRERDKMSQKSFDPEVLEILKQYSWPGNVGELKNVIEKAYVLSREKIVSISHLDNCVFQSVYQRRQAPKERLFMGLAEVERDHIIRVLQQLEGNKTRAAKVLGITVKTLYNKLHSYKMV